MTLEDLEKGLADGRELSEFDARAVAIVAQLIGRVREAREIIAAEGPLAAKESGEPIEHPAVKVERMASAEIRGWVKERPDLFGQRSGSAGADSASKADKFGGFKLVK
ncbi:P27 family phage terminase small subunit [Corynebacterium sp. HMSC05D03]|uniref:P27 family phage terminase small subunit n=1 Tax=Corynebacterium sp. HMSC05D03 TaxID=1581115 RepID=UPI0008A20AF2|nr:P27 family phage terminase small subunit [Corynebacterium sp. HMSC05D03]OFT67732.1 terminase [Corynebacterium sp. HMSC05D03]